MKNFILNVLVVLLGFLGAFIAHNYFPSTRGSLVIGVVIGVVVGIVGSRLLDATD